MPPPKRPEKPRVFDLLGEMIKRDKRESKHDSVPMLRMEDLLRDKPNTLRSLH